MSTRCQTVCSMRRRPLVCSILLALLLASPVLAGTQPNAYGLDLVPWSKKLEEGRYKSSRDWDGSLKFFRDQFRGWKGIRWHREVNLPTVKYVHIQNLNPKGRWSGVNIYQLPSGEVRMFVLKRLPPEDAKPDTPADGKAGQKADANPAPAAAVVAQSTAPQAANP